MGQELGRSDTKRTRTGTSPTNVMVYQRIPMLRLDRQGGAVAMKVGDAIRKLGASLKSEVILRHEIRLTAGNRRTVCGQGPCRAIEVTRIAE
jgi:hypothetical protein